MSTDHIESYCNPMISVIVCHRDEQLLADFQINLKESIGVSYELIVIDNRSNEYSIFEAYNKGVEQSRGSILCFAHEDIAFHTMDWGKKVSQHFLDDRVGLIGVVGGNCYPNAPSPWWCFPSINDHLINLIQHWRKFTPKQKYYTFLNDKGTVAKAYNNPTGGNSVPAVMVDGLWFCIPRELFEKIRFDSDTFSGFHCYDSDISLQVFQIKEVRVIFDVLIEHFSDANPNIDFHRSLMKLHDKWSSKLPLFAKMLDDSDRTRFDYGSLLEWAYVAQSSGFISDQEIRKRLSITLGQLKFRPKNKDAWFLWFWRFLGFHWARVPNYFIKRVLS